MFAVESLKRTKIAISILILLGVIGIAVFLIGTTKVDTVAVRKGEISQKIEDIGYVQSVDEQILHAPVAGRVSNLLVKEGDSVRTGQTLMTIDTPEWHEQLAALNAQIERVATQAHTEKINLELAIADLAEAERQLKLKETLAADGLIGQEECKIAAIARNRLSNSQKLREKECNGLDQQRRTLLNQRNHLQARLQGLEVKSALNGTILSLPVKLNQGVTLGTPLVHVGPTKDLEVEVKLLANDVAAVRVGQQATITNPGNAVGVVKRIYPEAQIVMSPLGVEERRVSVIIALKDPGILKPGFEVRASIITGQKPDALLLPRESISSTPGGDFQIRKIVNGKVVVQTVTLGQKNAEMVEILEGAQANDLVVRDGSLGLKQGSRAR